MAWKKVRIRLKKNTEKLDKRVCKVVSLSSSSNDNEILIIYKHKQTRNMARSVTYSVVPRRNPSEKGTPPKYYAQAQARGDVSIREMSERIQSSCTVNKADVYAVLVALEDVVAEAIQNGEIVRLGELCTLQVSLSGKGALTEEDYTESLIKRAKINFRPGKVLANALASLSFSKVAIKYAKEAEEEELPEEEE